MIAIDTNVLVRFFTGDNKKQMQKAIELIKNNHIFISKTIILETEWVLRYCYQYQRKQIATALRSLLYLQNVSIEDTEAFELALNKYEEDSFDFADILHIASSLKTDKFFTFDRKLANKAKSVKEITILLA